MGTFSLPGFRLLAASAFTSFVSTFVMGFIMSAFNEPSKIFQNFVNQSSHDIHGSYIGKSLLSGLWAFIISSFLIGQFVGSLCVPYFSNNFGIKKPLMIHANFITILGSATLIVAKPTDVFELLILGRFLLGLSSGLSGGLLAMFLSECSPDKYRGVIGNMQNLFITSATFIGTLLALDDVLGTEEFWPYLLSIPAILSLTQIFVSFWLPESPKYLYIQKNDRISAERSILYYHGAGENTEHVLATFEAEKRLQVESLGFFEVIQNRHLKWSALLSFTVPAASMFSGIMAVFNYSTEIFTSIKISYSLSQWTTVIMSGFNLIGGFLAIPMLERFGRRTLVLSGTFLIAGCNVLFIVTNQIGVQYNIMWLNYVAVICIIANVTLYNMSIGPVGWFYNAEIAPQAARSTCASLALISNSLFALLQTLTLPPLLTQVGSYVFLILIVPGLILGVFHLKFMPETKDKSVDEILKNWWRSQDFGEAVSAETRNLLDGEEEE